MEALITGSENVELSLPVNAAYVGAAKQTAFAVAGRLGFDAQEAYDIKTAVSEACGFLLKILKDVEIHAYTILFEVFEDRMNINISCPSAPLPQNDPDADYSLMRIQSLVDEAYIQNNGETIEIFMSKHNNEL